MPTPDQLPPTHQRPRVAQREIVLAELDTVRIHCQSKVTTVVDDQQGADVRRRLAQGDRLPVGLLHGGCLVTVLEETGAGVSGGLEDVWEVACPEDRRLLRSGMGASS